MFGVIIDKGPGDWEIVAQRGGFANIQLSGHIEFLERFEHLREGGRVFLSVACEEDGAIVVPPTQALRNGGDWRITLPVPMGGPYRLSTTLVDETASGWQSMVRGDSVFHFGVGEVFVIAGQSNASGYGRGVVTDAPEIGVHLLRNNGRWDLAAHPMNDSTQTDQPVNTEKRNPGTSPYLAFGKLLKRRLGRPVGLVQSALGGSALSRWNPEENGELYEAMMRRIASLAAGISGVLWYQGCSDVYVPDAESYYDRFRSFVTRMRDGLREPALPVYTLQINRHMDDSVPSCDHGWGLVKEAQRRAAREIPGVYILPTSDCATSDEIHLSACSNVSLGERLGRLALSAQYGLAPFSAPNLSNARQSGERALTLTFDGCLGELFTYKIPPCDSGFAVSDDHGEQTLLEIAANGRCIHIKTQRDLASGAVVSAFSGKKPCAFPPFDTATHCPILSFYKVPIR